MRQILTLIFFIFYQVSFGQLPSGSGKNKLDFHVFNNSKDTIYLTVVDLGYFTHTDSKKIIDSIQIDGIGSKEIIFERNIQGSTNEHGGMFDIVDHQSITKYEIWNLDTKRLLFAAVSSYSNNFNNSYAYFFNCGIGPCRKGQGTVTYYYQILFEENGEIIISNVKYDEGCTPDYAEGVYKFIDGRYILD